MALHSKISLPRAPYAVRKLLNQKINLRSLDLWLVYFFVFFPIWAMLLRLSANIFIWYISTLIYATSSIFVLARSYFERQLRIPVYVQVYLLFVIVTVVSNFLYTDRPWEMGVLKYLYSNELISSALALFVVANLHIGTEQLKKVIQAMTLVVLAASLVSVIQYFYPDFLFNRTESYQFVEAKFENRVWSIYSWTIFVDIGFSYLSFISIIFGVGMLQSKRNYGLLLLGLLISLLNGSRWVIVNAIVISFQDFLASQQRFSRFLKYSIYAFIGLFLLVLSLLVIGVDLNALFVERLMQDSASTRLVALEVFLDQFPLAPIWGTGGEYTEETLRLIAGRSSQIHVGFLAVFYLHGLIGGLLFVAFLFILLRKLGTVARKTGYWGSFYCFLGFFLANITLVSLEIYFHGLLLAIIIHNYFEKNAHRYDKKGAQKRRTLSLPRESSQQNEGELTARNRAGSGHATGSKFGLMLKNEQGLRVINTPKIKRINGREIYRQWAVSEQMMVEAAQFREGTELHEKFQVQKVMFDPEFFSKKVLDKSNKRMQVLRLLSKQQTIDWEARSRFYRVYQKELAYFGELSEIQESENGLYYVRPFVQAISLEGYLAQLGIPNQRRYLYQLKAKDQLAIAFLLKDLFNLRVNHDKISPQNTLVKSLNSWSLRKKQEIVLTGFSSHYVDPQEMQILITEMIREALGAEMYKGFERKFGI